MPDKQYNILLLCSRLDLPGGIERAVVNTAGLFAQYGHTVSIIVADTEGINSSYYPVPGNVAVKWINTDFGITESGNTISRKTRLLTGIRKTGKAIRAINPDIIISSEYQLSIAIVLSGAGKKARIFSWEHHHFNWLKPNRFWSFLKKITYTKLNGIICLNKTEADHYSGYTKTWVVPNFIQPVSVTETNTRRKEILTVGWLIERKGTDLIPEMATEILHHHPEWTWKILGSGELEHKLQEAIKQHKLQHRLIIEKPTGADLSAVYANAALFVLPSRMEAFPMVLLEAMSYGIPCISFDCPTGPGDIIQHNIDGLLVETGNTEKMIQAIDILISNEETRIMYGNAARANIQRFRPDKVMQLWDQVFKEVR